MTTSVLDDFADAGRWMAVASGEARLTLTSVATPRGRALRMDFDFMGGGGFVVARRELPRRLPDAFAFHFAVSGSAPANKLEFKLADPTGHNVWRWQEEAFAFTAAPRALTIRNRDLAFAWGPAGGGAPRQLGAVEFVISAGPGGRGSVLIEDFRFTDRSIRRRPLVSASSTAAGSPPPAAILTSRPEDAWRSGPDDARPRLVIDFHGPREYGGLVIDWPADPPVRTFAVEASDDGRRWRTLLRVRGARGARSLLPLHGGESRFVRLAFDGPAAVARLTIPPFEFSRTLVDFFHEAAARSPRGRFPRWLLREQSYWTCAGVADGHTCALVNEEGMVEPDKGSWSLEPFLRVQGRLVTWADARRRVRMEPDGTAVPTVVWSLPGLRLETTVCGSGSGTDVLLLIRHRLTNLGRRPLPASLFSAVRPCQVNPPWQAWQGLGGIREIHSLEWRKGSVVIDGSPAVFPVTRPDGFGAAAFHEGTITDHLAAGALPQASAVRDPFGFASGALQFDLTIPPGGTREVVLAIPASPTARRRLAGLHADAAPELFDAAVESLRRRTGQVSFRLPPGPGREAALTFRTAVGQILVNRDGPAIQPGPRRYTRSWIRDGVIMGAALHRAGEHAALTEFLRWYAPHQRADGFVPCCVDRNGPDWLVEHDSHGQLIHGIREAWRFTGDRDFLSAMWPHVRAAVRCLRGLRARRLTAAWRKPDKIDRLGLLPESASHEGYLAHPVHSYWDDFWALRGLLDAAALAGELGHARDAASYAALAADLRASIEESLRRVIAARGLTYVPGSVEWADFDPTATANAVTLLQQAVDLPAGPLAAMFEHFVRDFRRKHGGDLPWNNYTAYEIRIIGALVQLGRRDEALELLRFFLADRRPQAWHQWPEISWRNPRSPGHLGDVPHTWIAAEYLLVFARLFAFEREADDALVLAAGIDPAWLAGRGLAVTGLPTAFGTLDLAMRRTADGTLHVALGGTLTLPPGGFVLRPPLAAPVASLTVNGTPSTDFSATEATIRAFPARITLGPPPSGAAL